MNTRALAEAEGRGAERGVQLLAMRNRAVTLAVLAGLVIAVEALTRDRATRDSILTVFTAQLGYAHFAGAFYATRRRVLERVAGAGARWQGWTLIGCSVLSLFALCTWLMQSTPWLLAMLVVTLWHIVENDCVLGGAYRSAMRMPAMGRRLSDNLVPLGWTLVALWLLLAALSPAQVGDGSPRWLAPGAREDILMLQRAGLLALAACLWRGPHRLHGAALALAACVLPRDISGVISFEALYALISLYHYVSWLVALRDRAAARGKRDALAVTAGAHMLWFLAGAAALAWPASRRLLQQLGLLAPGLFLFWAVLHVAHSHLLRGLSIARSSDAGL